MHDTAVAVHDLNKVLRPTSSVSWPVARGRWGEIFATPGRNSAGNTMTMEILQRVRSRDGGHVAVLGFHSARERGDRAAGGW